MAQKVQVIVTCDLHDDDDTEALETVRFGFDGYDYELDLCADHSEEVHDQLQGLIGHARRAGGSRGGRRSTPSRAGAERPAAKARPEPRSGSDPERLRAIREWARSHGHPDVKSRGRIPQAIIEDYEAAHSE